MVFVKIIDMVGFVKFNVSIVGLMFNSIIVVFCVIIILL